jgi:DNA-binding transcriptional regulator YiaG
MAKGYSVITINEIRSANSQLLGVQLGLVCLKNDLPVTDVAEFFGVSRMTVYNWFKGRVVVSGKHAERMTKLIEKLK